MAPSELLFNRKINGKLPGIKQGIVDKHEMARENEQKSKEYNKSYGDTNRKCVRQEIKVGEEVLLKQQRKNKLMTRYSPLSCKVINVTGSEVTVVTQNGKFVSRNKSYFKRVPRTLSDDDDDDDESAEMELNTQMNDQEIVNPNTFEENEIRDGQLDESENLRRSVRQRRQPDRYGDPIPSDIISDFS